MSEIRIVTLYSGSKGNSTYIKMADTAILIDAGRSAKRLCAALKEIGSDIEEIRAIFITHDHSDHISALETLCKCHAIPIHMTDRSASVYDRYAGSPVHHCLKRHSPIYTVEIGDIRVRSFATPHDSLMSVGYRIEMICDSGKESAVAVATDIGYVTDDIVENLLGCEAVVVESNHDIQMVNDGPYPDYLKRRILSKRGHLSNAECGRLSSYLASKGTRAFMLAHLSEENNEPILALEETERAISDSGIVVTVADAHCPTELKIPSVEEVEYGRSQIYNPWNA